MRSSIAATFAAASFSISASATVMQTCPSSDPQLCYAVNIPDATASSGNGDIYFQISAPTKYQWASLGQGNNGMSGANIFVIYASADGKNVTLSPRLGKGEVMPLYDNTANVTLLEGSGISNGTMIANVKCSNCNSWQGGTMDFNNQNAGWMYAAKSGAALDSNDVEESIVQHDVHDSFNWNLTMARGGPDANPFVAAVVQSPTGTTTTSPQPTTMTSKSSSSGQPSSTILMAHGIMAAVAFALLFPIGGIVIRIANFSGLVWVHAAIQTIAFLVYTAAFGLGIYIATKLNYIGQYHPIIGIVVFGLLVFQPALGLLHHRKFKKTYSRNLWSFAHLGIGRVAIILGIVNGGLGLLLADNAGTHWIIAYSVVAGVFGLAYIATAVMGEAKKAKEPKQSGARGEKGSDRDYSMESASPLEQQR